MGVLKRARDVIGVEGTEGRNPFEQLILVWSVLSGVSLFYSSSLPGSIRSFLPYWMVVICYTLLCIGGLVGLVGVWLRNQILSLLWERVAMLVVGPASLLYASSILSLVRVNPRAWSSGIAVLFFALAALWRIYRIQSYLHKLRVSLAEAPKR